MSADSAMKCTPQNTMVSVGSRGGITRELEGVAGDIGELDNLVALVRLMAKMKSRSPRAAFARRARSTRAGSEAGGRSPGHSTALGSWVGLTPENEERERRPGTEWGGCGGGRHGTKCTHHRQWGRFVTTCGVRRGVGMCCWSQLLGHLHLPEKGDPAKRAHTDRCRFHRCAVLATGR